MDELAQQPAEVVRLAFQAFIGQDLETLRRYVDPDLSWTYLDPTLEDPEPTTCHGREQLEVASARWASMGLSTELEELEAVENIVLVVLHAPGLDRFRARNADDRNFHLATVSNGRVLELRACRDRNEARARAGLT